MAQSLNGRLGERYWRRQVRRWGRSGLSQVDFCRRERLSVTSLRWWKWQIGVREVRRTIAHRPEAPAGTPAFVPIRVVDSKTTAAGVEIVLRGGRAVRVQGDFDPAVLSKVIATLEAAPC